MRPLSLRHLVFTGPGVEPATLNFLDGLNILYGASNTGKSFATKALDFMFGSSQPLPSIEQRVDYESVWLGLILPSGQSVTISRSTSGGAFKVFDGLVKERPSSQEGVTLQPQHDAKRSDNLSNYLLSAIGLSGKVVAKNMNGEKDSLSFRNLAPYMFVSEEAIISERSPILASGQVIRGTVEKNTFKLLLTGLDDFAVETTLNSKTQKVARTAQFELIDEWIAQVTEELGDAPAPREEVEIQAERLAVFLSSQQSELKGCQDRIDNFVTHRRQLADENDATLARLQELELTLMRFGRLAEIYASDVARLEALEEGGFLLMSIAGRTCAVCGAPPEAQRHTHGAEEIERSHKAAAAEIRKISLERRDLRSTTESLESEAELLRKMLRELGDKLQTVERELGLARPREARARQGYEALLLKTAEVNRLLSGYDRLAQLRVRRSQLDIRRSSRRGDKLAVGIDSTTAFRFSKTVQAVLTAWNFPDAAQVQFDHERQDILVGGKERSANGKGVRALLHAAFKVAVLIFCHERGLPHPGILVLDTPLLTYREPLVQPKYGELEPDDLAIRESGLAERFYAHLSSLNGIGQFVMIENSDPPAAIRTSANIETFTGRTNVGRFGFFPPLVQTIAVPMAA